MDIRKKSENDYFIHTNRFCIIIIICQNILWETVVDHKKGFSYFEVLHSYALTILLKVI